MSAFSTFFGILFGVAALSLAGILSRRAWLMLVVLAIALTVAGLPHLPL